MTQPLKKGIEFGRRWAEHRATSCELAELADIRNDLSRAEWRVFFETHPNQTRETSHVLAMRLHPEWHDAGDWAAARDWWQELGHDDDAKSYHPDYLRGFAEGALSFWEESDLV